MLDLRLVRQEALPATLEALERESVAQGFTMVTRLRTEWASGANRFDRSGEIFLAAVQDDRLVGVGGLNIDPYAGDPSLGRLRHLYVLEVARRHGVGRALVERLVADATGHFAAIRLRTGQAASFYANLGFETVEEPQATHRLRLWRGG